MTTFVALHRKSYLGPLALAANTRDVGYSLAAAMVECTTYNDGGWECVAPGLKSGTITFDGFTDFAAGGVDDTLGVDGVGGQYAISVYENPTGTVTAGDHARISRGVVTTFEPIRGAVGEMAGLMIGGKFDAVVPEALVLHPEASRTATGTGTAVAMTGPTSSQRLYAALHVTAWSELTSLVVKVQTDDNSGFTSATDRLTFTTATGVTSEWSSVAGAFNTETYVRVSYTIVGTGSCTFACAAGVL